MPLEPELSWWRRECRPAGLPVDFPSGANTQASASHIQVWLSSEETRVLLQEAPAAYRMQIDGVLLTALAQTLGGPAGALRVDLEGHGREEILPDVDLSRTVGWFTTLFPVRLEVGADLGPDAALKTVKEHLYAIPNRGIGFGLLRYLCAREPAEELASMPQAEVSFNYLGQLHQGMPESSLLKAAEEASGPARSLRARRPFLLEVSGYVTGGRLQVNWSYSENLHHRATVERWAQRFLVVLRELIAHCHEAVERGIASYTPSDFPLAGIDQRTLDELLGTEHEIEEIHPLSPLQEGILFETLYAPDSGVYIEQLTCRFRGELDPAAFQGACRKLVDHHPVLRTSFHWQELDRPLQVVHGSVVVELEYEDWSGVPPAEQEQRLTHLLHTGRKRGFDLSRAPLMRWKLIRTGASEHWFLWTHHHILLDGWSAAALTAEFLACYEALRRGVELRLEPRPRYRDYIAWLQRQDLVRTEQFWRRALAGWTEPTILALDRRESSAGRDRRQVRLAAAQADSLQGQARRWQLTLNTLVQGAWGVLLGRYSGQAEVVFGATMSGRSAELPGIESMLGLLINTLPVRLDVGGQSRLLPWLRELQHRQAELRQYEYTPLVRVQEWSEVARGSSLFETILGFENYPREVALRQGGVGLGVVEIQILEQNNYALNLVAVPGEELLLDIEYDGSRFHPTTVERLLRNLCNLLEGMTARLLVGGEGRLAELPLLAEPECFQVLVEWNSTDRSRECPQRLHELFERQVDLTPEAVALVSEEGLLTYAELDRRATRLAHRLQGLGVGPEVPVGLCAERSLGMVEGLLAILQAGGAYVPLDPDYPRERLAFMLEDAAAPVLVVQRHLLARLPDAAAQVVLLEGIGLGADLFESRLQEGSPENLAYVIYTSGSTGRPKGVMVTHRSLSNYVVWALRTYTVQGAHGSLLHTSISFDLTVTSLWVPLLSGQRVVLFPESIEPLGATLSERNLSFVKMTPSHLRVLGQQVLPHELACWSHSLVLGGEALLGDDLALWREHAPATVICNEYGPTETVVGCSLYTAFAGDLATGSVPIGRPSAGARFYLLDRDLRLVPVGVPGELYIGGEGVARGYLDRPELTAEKFVPDLFGGVPGGRLYRTGDLVRWLSDGNVEFLGRLDQQVKVRGFRIELGEVEAALRLHPMVREAVVLAKKNGLEERRLVAYIELRGTPSAMVLIEERLDLFESNVTPVASSPKSSLSDPNLLSELKQELRQKLPEYMIPAVVILVPAMPLTANGKIDRGALLDPDAVRPNGQVEFVAPRTAAETALAAIWAEVLAADQVGIYENFFDRGGDSLAALRLMSQLRKCFGVRLKVRDLFAHPTVEALAARVEEALLEQAGTEQLDELLGLLERIEEKPHEGEIPSNLGDSGGV